MMRLVRLVAIVALIGVVAASAVFLQLVEAEPSGLNCRTGCKPWLQNPACAIGDPMKLRLILDTTLENQEFKLKGMNQTNSSDGAKIPQWQVGWGFCPTVDQLQAFQLTDSARWVAGSFKEPGAVTADKGTKYLRVFGAVGLTTKGLIPPNEFDSAVVISDPSAAANTCNGGKGVLIADFLVLNFTMDNGVYRMVSSFEQSVQVGFKPTCDDTGCMVDPSKGCIGPPGRQNCASCVSSAEDFDNRPIQVFAAYYGKDSEGRRMQSGASNPLNFRKMAETGVFSAVQSDLMSAVSKTRDFANKNIP